ncbi:MAG: formate dehydrogenase subunit gamma [Deltaproteobacteria bacterium]|nr:formate dehydrogenase subunit gamma [Deltaproteobacteria bacterium]
MQRGILSVFLLTIILVAGLGVEASAQEGLAISGLSAGSSADYYQMMIDLVSGHWQKYGQLFTTLQGQWFGKLFLAVIIAIPAIFLLHYLIIGAKHFGHDGEQIYFFTLLNRIVHVFAAISFTLLVVTGLLTIFGSVFGGGTFIRTARTVHLVSAMVFVFPCFLMFIMWFKDMLPRMYDISWMFMLGGYLSKEKKPVPAGKFNGGQKGYFWFATLGGAVMAYTGFIIWGFGADLDTIRLYTIIHNFLGAAIVAFYLTHVYMSVFAIAGSLESMKTGYKSKDEVDILHSRYDYN